MSDQVLEIAPPYTQFEESCAGFGKPGQVCGNVDSSSARPVWHDPPIIHYTTDGTTPAASSQIYSGPITLQHFAEVRARAVHGATYDTALWLLMIFLVTVSLGYLLLRTPFGDWRRGRHLRLLRNNQRRFFSRTPQSFASRDWK